MKNKFFTKIIVVAVSLAITVLLIFNTQSCTEDPVFPENTIEKILSFKVTQDNCFNEESCVNPLQDANILIYTFDKDNEKVLLDSIFTDSKGEQAYEFKGLVTGSILRVECYYGGLIPKTPFAEFLVCEKDTLIEFCFPCKPDTVCCDDLVDSSFVLTFKTRTIALNWCRTGPRELLLIKF